MDKFGGPLARTLGTSSACHPSGILGMDFEHIEEGYLPQNLHLVAPAKSLTVSDLMENPFVGKKLKS